eukprot:362822-Chlamydomonas_euryale.AAC.34
MRTCARQPGTAVHLSLRARAACVRDGSAHWVGMAWCMRENKDAHVCCLRPRWKRSLGRHGVVHA